MANPRREVALCLVGDYSKRSSTSPYDKERARHRLRFLRMCFRKLTLTERRVLTDWSRGLTWNQIAKRADLDGAAQASSMVWQARCNFSQRWDALLAADPDFVQLDHVVTTDIRHEAEALRRAHRKKIERMEEELNRQVLAIRASRIDRLQRQDPEIVAINRNFEIEQWKVRNG